MKRHIQIPNPILWSVLISTVLLASVFAHGSSTNKPNERFHDLELIAVEWVTVDNEQLRSELRRMGSGKVMRTLFRNGRVSSAFMADELIVGLKTGSEARLQQAGFEYTKSGSTAYPSALLKLESTSYFGLSSALRNLQDSGDFRYVQKNFIFSAFPPITGELPFQPFAIRPDGTKESWFGSYRDDFFPWIDHETYGFLYVDGMNPEDIWFWSHEKQAWFYTKESHGSFFYRPSDDAWLFRNESGEWFYNYNTADWEYRAF